MNPEFRATGLWLTLQKIPVETVARIAATLPDQKISPGAAVMRAYELLEMSIAAKLGLDRDASFESGITEQERNIEENKKFREAVKALPAAKKTEIMIPLFTRDEGKQFLKQFFPNLSYEKAEERFCEWLAFHFEESPQTAKKRFAGMKKTGVPESVVCVAFSKTAHPRAGRTKKDVGVKEWLEDSQKEKKRRNGSKGGIASQKKQRKERGVLPETPAQ
jgi:hypothetical protein